MANGTEYVTLFVHFPSRVKMLQKKGSMSTEEIQGHRCSIHLEFNNKINVLIKKKDF